MAKFTSFDAPTGTAGPISVRRATADDFGGDGGGLIKGGENIMRAGKLRQNQEKILKNNEIKKDNAAVNQANIDNQGYGADLFRTVKEKTDANATDFTPQVLAEYDKNMEAVLAGAKNDRVRQAMKADFTRTRNSLVQKASVFESLTRSKNEVNVFVGNGDKAANIMFETPTEDQYETTKNARQREVDNTSLPDHVKAELMRDEVKALRFKQYAGMLEVATNPQQVDDVLKARPGDEMSKESFTQLGNAGEAKKRRFKIEARMAKVERKQDIRDAQASIRVMAERLGRGETPDAATMKHAEGLVGKVDDPVTSEMLFNVTTVGRAINGWRKLPSEDLDGVVAGLEKDVVEGGATALESQKLAAARSVLSKTETRERKEQVEIDTEIRDDFDTVDKRLAAGVDLSNDPTVISIIANLDKASPRLQQQIKEAFALNDTVQGLVDMSRADLTTLVTDLQADRQLSDLKIVERDAAIKVKADMDKTVDKNYVDWQQKIDPAVFPPLDETNGLAMQWRQTLMEQGARKYGKKKQFHTTAELKGIAERLPEMSSDQQLAFINGYTANMSSENAAIALTELADVNPQLAFVGTGIAHDPSYALTGQTILRGQQILTNEGAKRIEAVLPGTTKSQVESIIGAAMIGALRNENLHPKHNAAVQSSALAIIASGVETDPEAAVNMALGGADGYGGIQVMNGKKFAAPVGVNNDMIDDAFDDTPGSITALSVDGSSPRTLNNVAVTGEKISDGGTMEKVGPDRYVVRMKADGKLLQGAPGTPYTLHITKERLLALGVKP